MLVIFNAACICSANAAICMVVVGMMRFLSVIIEESERYPVKEKQAKYQQIAEVAGSIDLFLLLPLGIGIAHYI